MISLHAVKQAPVCFRLLSNLLQVSTVKPIQLYWLLCTLINMATNPSLAACFSQKYAAMQEVPETSGPHG